MTRLINLTPIFYFQFISLLLLSGVSLCILWGKKNELGSWAAVRTYVRQEARVLTRRFASTAASALRSAALRLVRRAAATHTAAEAAVVQA